MATSTIQSRACAGVAQGTYIFCLPGSPGACRDAWNDILEWQLDNRHRPCNFVEIMPRLEEHRRKANERPANRPAAASGLVALALARPSAASSRVALA